MNTDSDLSSTARKAQRQANTTGISCVVVTYNPEYTRFQSLLDAVSPQVERIFVVDNGSNAQILQWLAPIGDRPCVHWIPLGRNLGIASALNVGISRALEMQSSHVLLLDHDSIPAADMVARLRAAAESLAGKHALAAIGPRYVDDRQANPPPFIRVEGLRLVRCQCQEETDVVPVDYLISSGSLIPAETLRVVGGMAEELFIDYVDIEWGLRARQHGYQSFGVCAAHMEHDLGDAPVQFLGRQIPLHSPLRHYYHMRNAVSLYLRSDFPIQWKLVDGWRLLLKYGFYSLLVPSRWRHFSMMTRGIWDGLRGKLGPLLQRSST